MTAQPQCKICDVRDYATAETCALLGVDFLGLHCIDGIKPDRAEEYRGIASTFPSRFPETKIVVVTRITDFDVLIAVLRELAPAGVQLHHAFWNRDRVVELREMLHRAAGARDMKIIGVGTPDDVERADGLSAVADMIVLDRTYYGQGGKTPRIPPEHYRAAVERVKDSAIPCLVAGGLNPDNTAAYLDVTGADGVDVQTGVEIDGQRGVKDYDAIRRLVTKLRSRADR